MNGLNEKMATEKQGDKTRYCVICGMRAAELVEGAPTCEDHVKLVYEQQLEDSTKARLSMPQKLN